MTLETIPELATRFGLPSGDVFRRLYTLLPFWLGASFAYWTLAIFAMRKIRPFLAGLQPRCMSSWRDGAGLAAFSVVLVLLFDGSGFIHGFFRQDDFSFLQVTRETSNIGTQLLLRHNDHIYPFFRAQFFGLTWLAGADADAAHFAGWFNGLTFLTCVALLLSAGWLLHELGGSSLTIYLLVFVIWVWPGWGEFTAGFYTLSAYLQVQTLATATAAATLRGCRCKAWLAVSIACAGTALALNPSGVVALVAAFAASLARGKRDQTGAFRLHQSALLMLAIAYVLLYYSVAQTQPVPRELVQNPAGAMLDSSIQEKLRQQGLSVLLAAIASVGGAALNLVVPTFLQLRADDLANNPTLRSALFGVESTLSLGLAAVSWRLCCRFSSERRRLALPLVATTLAALGIVVAARPDYSATVPASLWHAKYMMMPTCWICLFALFTLGVGESGSPKTSTPLAYTSMYVFAAGLWATASIYQWEKTLLPHPLAYTARGRWGNVDNAKDRRAKYELTMRELAALRVRCHSDSVVLPPPQTWQAEFFRQRPTLEWATDYTPRGVTHLFSDFPSAAPGLNLRIRWQPINEVSAEHRASLRAISWLRNTIPDNH